MRFDKIRKQDFGVFMHKSGTVFLPLKYPLRVLASLILHMHSSHSHLDLLMLLSQYRERANSLRAKNLHCLQC